ncbi:hypothetical protein PUNSTDRAFT_78170 [Punctularia strigosozonata HHB-11173 SS5]|uniref:Integrase core domain-containing protein n=1 Tax=Punctularia strigosozonata (strain HHB-11173) TaxID=741275 RepID=R7S0S6_PUNST|nr:uncharacterized protein PUNSTDRAFT_78170 [Punctularia strigosozonata HHB-11173 SS5]EIN03454.1 hypothetical protein PUNSTDRAFT_78170 [Punctularia strigosozonata HHB-11173 SS5]
MEAYRGERRGSYIWGRSVHNVRIERLWVDVTSQVGAAWSEAFYNLELRHGLDVNNSNHLWLLHYLFLPRINQELTFFAQSWSQHQIRIRGGPNRSPADMFFFDMYVHGVRGDQLLSVDEAMPEDELEVFGVDWEALRDDNLANHIQNPRRDQGDGGSWLGRSGPPEHLNSVPVDPPHQILDDLQSRHFNELLTQWSAQLPSSSDIPTLWSYSLTMARVLYGDMF